jgi:hypothetical protein
MFAVRWLFDNHTEMLLIVELQSAALYTSEGQHTSCMS